MDWDAVAQRQIQADEQRRQNGLAGARADNERLNFLRHRFQALKVESDRFVSTMRKAGSPGARPLIGEAEAEKVFKSDVALIALHRKGKKPGQVDRKGMKLLDMWVSETNGRFTRGWIVTPPIHLEFVGAPAFDHNMYVQLAGHSLVVTVDGALTTTPPEGAFDWEFKMFPQEWSYVVGALTTGPTIKSEQDMWAAIAHFIDPRMLVERFVSILLGYQLPVR